MEMRFDPIIITGARHSGTRGLVTILIQAEGVYLGCGRELVPRSRFGGPQVRAMAMKALPYERFELMRYGYAPHLEHLSQFVLPCSTQPGGTQPKAALNT